MESTGYSKPFLWLMGALATVFVAGCGSSDGGGGAQLGSLSVSLTDAPACGFDAVNVTVDRVRVHQSSSVSENAEGWSTIAIVPPRKINLLDLNDPTQPNFALEQLGVTPLEAGHYTQVRLVLVGNSGANPLANSVILSTNPPNTNEIALDTPSAVQSGIKLVHQVTVNSGQRTDLLLDFDACHSIVKTGNGAYKLKPVIKVIPYALNGIKGFLDTALFPGQLNANNVIVSAQMGGNIVRSTTPNAATGEFFLARLDPGSYDVVITANNAPTNTCCSTAVISGVPVPTDTSITQISTDTDRLTLQASTLHTIGDTVALINPPSPPATDDRDDATVIVVAKQALSGGPTVTVRSQVASLRHSNPETVGDYEYGLVLPIVAPSRGVYGSLPIPLSPTAVAGIYSIHGSAQTPTASYTIQSPALPSVNIVGGDDLTRDFTLAP